MSAEPVDPELLRDKIADYVAGRLEAETARRVRSWLLTDETAREFADHVRMIYDLDFERELAVVPPEKLAPIATGASSPTGAPSPTGASSPTGAPSPTGASSPTDSASPDTTVRRSSPTRTPLWIPLAAAAALLVAGWAGFSLLRSGGGAAPDGGTPGGSLPGESDLGGGIVDAGREVDSAIEFEPVPFLPVVVERPALPGSYRDGEWLRSREDAVLVSRYTGRPLVESYINPACVVSRKVKKDLCERSCKQVLSKFVCYEEEYCGRVPRPVEGEVDPSEIVRRLPAVRVSAGSCDPETAWGVRDWDEVRGELEKYRDRCAREGGVPPAPLDETEYERSLALVRNALELVDQGRLGDALTDLAEIHDSAAGRSTAFGPTAARLESQIRDAIDNEIARIHSLLGGGPVERAQGRDLAARLLDRVRGADEIEARVAELASSDADAEAAAEADADAGVAGSVEAGR